MIIIKTETGVAIILVCAILMVIFTVINFEKTSRDLEMINASVQKRQEILNEYSAKNPKN